ncbi:MAG: MerR family transcriptional regulator [Ilumatobacteraceae bacterium]
MTDQQFLTISEFARSTRLTVKALRIYDDNGLLRPVDVDPSNGYRWYGVEQISTALMIGLLRGADMGLAEIALLLRDLASNPEVAAKRLGRYLEVLELQHTGRRLLIHHIHASITKEPHTMFEIKTRHVPATRVMSIQRRLHAHETDAFVAEAKAAFADLLSGQAATGPLTLIFHGVVDMDNDGPIEATLPCSDNVTPTELVGIRTEPAHDEVYTTITKAEWEYPAILAAYDAVACCPEALARPGSQLSCREVYCAEPDEIGDTDLICDIAFPLGEACQCPEL